MPFRILPILALFAAFFLSAPSRAADAAPARTRAGLQVLYDFSSTNGDGVVDRSGIGKPVNLVIGNLKSVRRTKGALEVRGRTLIQSKAPAKKITEAVRRSGEITIEAWITPTDLRLKGPARIVTLSGSANERNFTLGQDQTKVDARFRTTTTGHNGVPSLSSNARSLAKKRTHVVYTRDRSGRARLYLHGKKTAEKTVAGATSNWKESFKLGLANELDQTRPWLGTFHLVALYNRALLPGEVAQNFAAGAGAGAIGSPAPETLAQDSISPHALFFETEIAPLLAETCLECHDAAVRKGKLDLSRKKTALAGSEDGPVIVPGNLAKSVLWEAIASDDMPKDGTPLTPGQKALVKKWIEDGATWSLDTIDPADYLHGGAAGDTWVQRLTVPEYIETVRSAVAVDIAKEARAILPPDMRADGFSNTAYNLNVDLAHVDAHGRLAEIIVDRMNVLEFARQFHKSRRLIDDDNRALIAAMGKWILRGPLTEKEIVAFRGISTTVASAGGDFETATRYVLEAMLQSPRFIYRVENQRGDGDTRPASEYELASRLSYIIWGGPPGHDLMRAADGGDLYDRNAIDARVDRMLKDPRAADRSAQFVSEWLDLDRMANLRPNPEKFPDWKPALAADMRHETLAFFRDIVWDQNRPLSDLLNAQVTHVTPRLAAHYGLKSIGSGKDDRLSRYDLASVPARGGLLTQGSVLTLGGDNASTVTRGLFVLHDLLRGGVKDPPPGTDTTPVPSSPGLTQRTVAERRIADRSCGGCHSKFEPLAFGLEKFDGLGTFYEKDEFGNQLREDGEILIPGEAEPVRYATSAELMNLLAKSDRVRETLTWKVTQFALGRPLTAADGKIVRQIHREAQACGGTYPATIKAIVMSDLVQMTRTEKEEREAK